MEITGYETFEVPPRWCFLRLETDAGIDGWGEPVLEGRTHTVDAAVEELIETYLLGEDPREINRHWERLYRGGFYRGGPVLMSALAGIDQALWDIKGKRLDRPVYELLGGRSRDRVRVYQWIGGDRPAAVADEAAEKVEEGFTAFKMNATADLERIDTPAAVEAAADRLRSVREAVGDDIDIAVDFHGRASRAMAKRLAAALDPFEPFFIEEPVLPEHLEHLPSIAEQTSAPIATGERLFSRYDVKSVLSTGAVDVLQPDLSHAGGITEVQKIAAMADAHDVALAPHCPLGPIALAACIQVDAIAPNALIQEQSLNMHYNVEGDVLDYVRNRAVFDFTDGYVELPEGPGLGVEIDEGVVRDREADIDYHNPIWRRDDGSIAEW